MKKRLLSAALALVLCCSVASAAGNGKGPGNGTGNGTGNGNGFQHRHQYQQYADVAGHWCEPYAKSCMETGLMQGVGNGFAPGGIVSNAEVAVVAARIRETLTGEAIVLPTPKQGETILWYQGYLDYLTAAGVKDLGVPTETATRGSFVSVFSQVLPDENMQAINQITALPDTKDPEVLRCYNAGILTGTDDYGTFYAQGKLTRGELAAMVARITDTELRTKFTPQPAPENSMVQAALGYPENTALLTVGGVPVPAQVYCHYLFQEIYAQDAYLSSTYQQRLDWNQTYGDVTDLPAHFKEQALQDTLDFLFRSAMATQLNCKVEDVPAALTPATDANLDAFIKENDLLRCKHILISTVDLNTGKPLSAEALADAKKTVDSLVALLKKDPSEKNFDKLMLEHSQDGGLAQNPNGYVFTKGQMVPEFEAGTRALAVGKIGAPVKSEFGYHIILRLDPKGDATVMQGYQQQAYGGKLSTWLESAKVTGSQLLSDINPQKFYEKALPYVQAQSK